MSKFQQFRSETGGNVAMMFSVALTFILIAIGASLDRFGMSSMQGELQSQIDAATLAGASVTFDDATMTPAEEEAERRAVALNVLRANGFDLSDEEVTTKMTTDSFMVAANETYSPFFGKLMGGERLIGAESESGLGAMQGMEIALVLDNTYSMQIDGKLTALKLGANKLVDAVEQSGSGTRIAVVPFSRYVRIPDSMHNEPWLDVPAEFDTSRPYQQAHHTGGTCTTVEDTRMSDGFEETYDRTVCSDLTTTYTDEVRLFESRFDGCVGTRPPPFAEKDGNYNANKVPGLLSVYPHEATTADHDIYPRCPRSIRPLSDDYSGIRTMITGLSPIDDTHLPTGLIWGQRVLSPGAPFDDVPAGSAKGRVMIFMTDGKNTTEILTDQQAENDLKAPPFIASSDDDDGQYSPATNAATTRLCTAIKDSGTIIYTISFKVEDPATKTLLRNCATDPEKAYTAETNDALVASFERISRTLESTVRLMR